MKFTKVSLISPKLPLNHDILELGNFLRDRYSSLISPNYRREELYIRSTDRDRTLLSAVSNLGSFYNVSSPGFVPFPVHTVPIKDDKILRMPVTGCNKYDQIKHELTKTPLMDQLNEKYRSELDKLGELGKSEEPLQVHTMWPVIDSIDCHIANEMDGKLFIFYNYSLRIFRYCGSYS